MNNFLLFINRTSDSLFMQGDYVSINSIGGYWWICSKINRGNYRDGLAAFKPSIVVSAHITISNF